jgi:hypothetical protein
MSQPPTLIISEDEDRTLVDYRTGRDETRPPIDDLADRPTSRPRALFLYLRHRASGLVLTASLALGLALSATVYYQWQALHRLSEALVAIGAAPPSRPVSESSQPPAPTSAPKGRWGPPVGEITPAGRSALEARGAALLGANDFAKALVHYRQLADLFPAETVFQDVVTALEHKLRCKGLASSECP